MAVPFLVALLCAAGRDLEGTTSWLTSSPMVFAGEASFALYLVHELAIVNLLPYMQAAPWLNAAIMVAIALVAAVVLHLGVERPLNRLLRGKSPSVALVDPGAAASPVALGERPDRAIDR